MEPAEADEWLTGRPKQLVFLTGLDPTNKTTHKALADTFTNRSTASLPLNLRLVRGELDLPGKRTQTADKGILRLDWPIKYLEHVPALIVLFLDLDWDHTSWAEKKTEAESKCASIRASCRQGSRLAVVLLQERSLPTPSDDPLATERAHELCHICQLSPKQLFVVPMLCSDLYGYINKLETAFHELAQGFYQQKLKAIRARSIPNNTPSLVVRQLFKLAFLSELRQDTHTALRNYRLAYEQCKESFDHWEDINIFEWRSVVGLLNYKWCELCFLHSTAVEAINQMRKHQTTFFNMKLGVYPTPQLASIEHQLWKAKQCYNFAKLFERAVAEGLSALPTLNPGSHLDLAASVYSQAHNEIASLKQGFPVVSYPSPDPMAHTPIFLGQRPWRVGYEGLATDIVEKEAIIALVQRLIVNHAGVIDLLSAAMTQYRRYGCSRMQLKVMNEMAKVYFSSGDIPKGLQLSCIAIREGLPPTVRLSVLQRCIWASYTSAAIKDFIWCCLQLANENTEVANSLLAVLNAKVPQPPFENPSDQQTVELLWNNAFKEKQDISLIIQKIDTCIQAEACFLRYDPVDFNETISVLLRLSSTALTQLIVSKAIVHFDLMGSQLKYREGDSEICCEVENIILEPKTSTSYVCLLNLSQAVPLSADILNISKITLVFENASAFSVSVVYDQKYLRRNVCSLGTLSLKFTKNTGGIEADGDQISACLVGEIGQATLTLKNTTNRPAINFKLEFKRNEQTSSGAAAVLFVDDANELRSELNTVIPCQSNLESCQIVSIPVRFSAQIIGEMDLVLEASYNAPGESQKRTSKIPLSVKAREPFTVSSQILTMNGVPVNSLLNYNEHILKADVSSNADITITRVEWLLADVVSAVHEDEKTAKSLEEQLSEGDVISFCKAISVDTKEENVETPLGRLAVEWRRDGLSQIVRTIVALCRLPVLGCPVVVTARVDTTPAVVRQPIRITYSLVNKTMEVMELTTSFDFTENFMFCGDKKVNFRLLPGSSRQIDVVAMALTGGRLSFPCPSLKSPTISEYLLQQALRSLPASLFVLPCIKESNTSEALFSK